MPHAWNEIESEDYIWELEAQQLKHQHRQERTADHAIPRIDPFDR
jgi:hypothetical protein